VPDRPDIPEDVVEATEFVGRWVRLRSNGSPFKVHYLGHRQKNGRQRLYGPVECVWPEEVEMLAAEQENEAREEWGRNVR
jgi:hypothetical protein